jgi:DNA-directed RNA polymerase subunit M/transcription elongation factor TFIIS
MRGNTFANTFKDSGKGGYEDPRHARLDKAVVEKTPRATARPAAQRIRVRCEGCRKEKVVPLSEVSVRHDEDMRPERFYRCDRCCTKGV